jgi:hypothetical protein
MELEVAPGSSRGAHRLMVMMMVAIVTMMMELQGPMGAQRGPSGADGDDDGDDCNHGDQDKQFKSIACMC